MKAKKEYILLAIVIIAVSLYLFSRNGDKTHYQLPEIPVIDKKDITKIEVSNADSTIILNKTDNKWFILPEEYPADTGKVDSMLKIIEEFELETLVSEKETDHLFDLTDDKKRVIKAWAEDTLKLDFEMGRPAPSWNHTFVRMAGDIRVYHAKGNFKTTFDQTADKMRDKTALSFDQNEIEGMDIIKGKETLALVKRTIAPEASDQGEDEGNTPAAPTAPKVVWENTDGKPADDAEINSMLSTLSNLKCENYADDQKKENYTDAIYSVKLKGVKDYTLSIYKKIVEDGKIYPAISSENNYPFLISDSQAEKIMKGPDEIIKKEEAKE
jgi:hypothetical protein